MKAIKAVSIDGRVARSSNDRGVVQLNPATSAMIPSETKRLFEIFSAFTAIAWVNTRPTHRIGQSIRPQHALLASRTKNPIWGLLLTFKLQFFVSIVDFGTKEKE